MNEKNHIPIFYEGQDDLIEILATSMVSICYNTKSFIDFYILDCGINNFNKKLLESMTNKFDNFSIEFIPIDLQQFNGLKGWGLGNFLDCYARLLIPELKPNLDKIIYLDSDTIALDDINLLWQIDLENYTYAAVPDIGYDSYFQNNCVKNLGISKNHIYPNAGVLLINTKNCRKIKFTSEILELAKKKKNSLLVIIEDLLSMYFGNNNYKKLDNRFNITDRSNEICKTCAPFIDKEYLSNEWKNAVIQHLSPGKSWKIARNNYNGNFLKLFSCFWFFAKMTPFYNGLCKKFDASLEENNFCIRKKYIKLFGLPFLKILQKENKLKYKLFGCIPMLSVKIK